MEAFTGTPVRLTIVGGAEAHLLAPQLAKANVGVIVIPVRSFPFYWEGRRTPAAIASRWLLHEAQQAHYYGLPASASFASVTTTAAKLIGLDYHLGYIKQGEFHWHTTLFV